MSNTDKQITLEEMLEMFGGRIPMEALILLNEPGDRTLDQIRNELRTLPRPSQDTRDKLIEAVERIKQRVDLRPHLNPNDLVAVHLGDLRTIINALPSQEAIKRVLEADENVVSCGCCDAELHELSKAISTLCVGGK
jgi:hypothetical protein